MADEVKIPISLPGAAAAAADAGKVAGGLQQIGKATEQAGAAAKTNAAATQEQGAAAKEAGKHVLSMGETTEKGIGIGMLFARVMQGDALALLNVTSALKVTGAAMKANAVGIALLAVTALGSFLQNLKGTTKEVQKETDAAGELLEQFRTKAAALSQQRFDLFKANIDDLTAKFKDLRDRIDEAQAAADKLDDAEMAAQLAENKVRPGMDDAERARTERSIRRGFLERRREREEGFRQQREGLAVDELTQRKAAESEAGADVRARLATVDDNRNRMEGLLRTKDQVQRLMQGEPEIISGSDALGNYTEKLNPKLQEFKRLLDAVDRLLSAAQSDQARAHAAQAEVELDKSKSAFELAAGQTNTADKALRDLRRQNATARDVDQKIYGPGGYAFRENYATTYGAVPDLRAEHAAPYKIPTVIVDGRSENARRADDALRDFFGDTPAPSSSIPKQVAGSISVKNGNGEEIGNQIADAILRREQQQNEAIMRVVERRLGEFFGDIDRRMKNTTPRQP